jgi:hypothetical protein
LGVEFFEFLVTTDKLDYAASGEIVWDVGIAVP